jgi:hypothetical protein
MKSDAPELSHLITGMRAAYARGENAMAWARTNSEGCSNTLVSALVAYDLQAGRIGHARIWNTTPNGAHSLRV